MDKTLQERIIYSNRLIYKHPDRVPVIIEKGEIELENYKYLLPKDMFICNFLSIIRTKLNKTFDSRKAIFTFVKGEKDYFLIKLNETFKNVYNDYKNVDGFLYIKFGVENTFG